MSRFIDQKSVPNKNQKNKSVSPEKKLTVLRSSLEQKGKPSIIDKRKSPSPQKLKKSESSILDINLEDNSQVDTLQSNLEEVVKKMNDLISFDLSEISEGNEKIEGKKLVQDLFLLQKEYSNIFAKINDQNLKLKLSLLENNKKYRNQLQKFNKLKVAFEEIEIKDQSQIILTKLEIQRLKELFKFEEDNRKLLKKIFKLKYTQTDIENERKEHEAKEKKEFALLKKVYDKVLLSETLTEKIRKEAKNSTIEESIFEANRISRHSNYLRINSNLPDDIDDQLTEFLESFYNSKNISVIPFEKRGSGNYTFGTQNIGVKIENGKLIVKTGNTTVDIAKFIEQNANREEFKSIKNIGKKDSLQKK